MNSTQKSRFPLASIFLLIGCVAVALAGMTPREGMTLDALSKGKWMILVLGGPGIFALAGAIAGCRPGRRVRGAIIGFVAGWVAGALILARMISRSEFLPVLIGAVALAGACVVYRMTISRPEVEGLTDRQRILREARAAICEERAAEQPSPASVEVQRAERSIERSTSVLRGVRERTAPRTGHTEH